MIHRLLRFIRGSKPVISSFEIYKSYFEKGDSTIILKNSAIRFDVAHKTEARKYIKIGEKGLIAANFIFESEKGEVVIGNNVHLGGVTFISRNKIEIHDDVTMAWGITIYDHNSHSIHWLDRKNDNHQCYDDYINNSGNNIVNKNWSNVISKPVCIHSKVWVGFNVIILKGVVVGEGAVIGAGSVVTKDVEPWTVVGGNPAVLIKEIPIAQRG